MPERPLPPPPPPVPLRSHWNDRLYCDVCGSPLDEYTKSDGFDEMSGEEKFKTRKRCPKRRRPSHWWWG